MKTVRAIIDTHLLLRLDDLSDAEVWHFRDEHTRKNPKWGKANSMGFWTGDIPKEIISWSIDDPFLILPRGILPQVTEFFDKKNKKLIVVDNTVSGEKLKLKLLKELYPFQQVARNELSEALGGLVTGPPGSGKTIILLGAIAALNRSTMIVVHSKPLMRQWEQRCLEWFGFAPGTIGGAKVC